MSAGKGDSPRSLGPKFRENYDRIFKKSRVEGRTSRASKPALKRRNETLNTGRTVSPHP